MNYNQNGNIAAIVGLAVVLLSKFGIITTADTLFIIIGAVVSIVGIYKQYRAHRSLGVALGAVK